VCRERCIVVLRDAIVVARAQQSETVWRQRKNYGIDGIRASWVPHLRARERAYSSAFLSVCVSPERFRRGILSPRWVRRRRRGGETRGDRDAISHVYTHRGGGRVKTPRVVTGRRRSRRTTSCTLRL